MIAIRSVVAVALLALASTGCDTVECSTDLFAGGSTYRGRASGSADDADIEVRSVRAACNEYCAKKRPAEVSATPSTKREDFGGCAEACVADVAGKRLGVRTSCVEP